MIDDGKGKAEEALQRLREVMGKLKPTVDEVMGKLKLAINNEKMMIAAVGWIGAALAIIGAGMIWGWGGVLLSFGLWLYTAAIREERQQ